MLGFALLGSTLLLPLFMQTLLGYTAEKSGLALMPGGFTIMLLLPLVGFLLSRYSPRWLLVFGLVGDDRVDLVVLDVGAVAIAEELLGDRHADAVAEALAERAGRDLDAGGHVRPVDLRVPGGDRLPLAEALELVHRQVVARQVERRVEQHRPVAGAEDEAVAVRPGGSFGSWRMIRRNRTYAVGAMPIGSPWWPWFSRWTASIARVRIVLMNSRSISWVTRESLPDGSISCRR